MEYNSGTPKKADFGKLLFDGREYTFVHRRDYFILKSPESPVTGIKIFLHREDTDDGYRWIPDQIYQYRPRSKKRKGHIGPFNCGLRTDEITSVALTRAVEKYKKSVGQRRRTA